MNKFVKKSLNLSSRKILFGFVCALLSITFIVSAFDVRDTQASTSGNPQSTGIWVFVAEDTIGSSGQRQIIPQVYRTAQVNQEALRQLLGKAPLEFTQEAKDNQIELALPMPDGTFSRFRIEDSPIMEAGLAAQYPEIKTYRGQGIDDPAATVRFDLTPAGFHAMILSERGTVYIDPYAQGDTTNYITYYKADYRSEAKPFQCYFEEDDNAPQGASQPVPYVANGTVFRTYRLALAATVEYTATKGGTVVGALAGMTTTMNRVNGVYERDLAVRMVLVANNNLIISTAEPDGYTNNSGSAMLGQNQTRLDTVIGTANYDIGHVFSTGGGGVAGLNVVCLAGNKARGVTGLPDPSGDVFAIDFVAHEMGHQFGGRHTFNGTASNCGGGNRSSTAAYEPGSGSTIMAYAGICGTQDLQSNSDDYFHVKSLEEIAATIAADPCDQETATGNTLPTVTVGPTVTIPIGTPFTLTATASDANGDAITYCWEEYDLGTQSPPDTDASGARPIFRSFDPTTNPSRTFPKLSDVLGNVSTFGESLPSINRTMNFQVTVRDNRAAGGGINTATQQVIVSAGAGPFLVTAPNTAVSWTGGTQQAVTWNVANTSGAPVNAANVKISLSTDGGNTFPTVLTSNTPNDGTQNIIVPNTPTTMARVKVEAVGNIFFDVSNANFTITGGSCTHSLSASSQSFPAAASIGSVTLTTQGGCNWPAESNVPWISITSGASGTGNGTVQFSVLANGTGAIRNGTLTIAGQVLTVYQGLAFIDVPEGAPFYTEIGKLAARGVTLGCGGNNYCPTQVVTREQMAAFIIRSLGEFNPPTPGSQRFTDVLPSNPFYNFVDRMAVLNITLGCGGSNYCPTSPVIREQMAAFLMRAKGEFAPPTPPTQRFNDVPPSNQFYNFIDRLAVLNITLGCSATPPLYCPAGVVTRAEMAAFLVRAFNL